MINEVFTAADSFIRWMATVSGISYEAVNVYIFIVIWPIYTLALMAVVIIQRGIIRKLRSRNSSN